jgi:hypothetical protein
MLAGVGLGATAGTLKIGQGSSGAAACLVAPAPTTRAHISSRTPTCPVAPAPIFGHRTALGPPRASWL